jgi:hypothetical protein
MSSQLINYLSKEEKELQFPTYRDSFHRCRKRTLTGTSAFDWRIKRLKFGLHTFLRHLWNREYRFRQSAIARLCSPHMHARHVPTYLPTYLPTCLPTCLPIYLPSYLPVRYIGGNFFVGDSHARTLFMSKGEQVCALGWPRCIASSIVARLADPRIRIRAPRRGRTLLFPPRSPCRLEYYCRSERRVPAALVLSASRGRTCYRTVTTCHASDWREEPVRFLAPFTRAPVLLFQPLDQFAAITIKTRADIARS